MKESAYIIILNRQYGIGKSMTSLKSYEVIVDQLEDAVSSFNCSGDFTASIGDILVLKTNDQRKVNISKVNNIAFIGIISAIEDTVIKAQSILHFFDFEIVTYTFSGTNAEFTLSNIIRSYMYNDTSKLFDIIQIDTIHDPQTTSIPYSIVADEEKKVGKVNLKDFIISWYKKYGVTIWSNEITMELNGSNINCDIQIKSDCPRIDQSSAITIKDTFANFYNWEFFISPTTYNDYNMLSIIDAEATNSIVPPVIYATYFITEQGQITQVASQNVKLPTRQKVFLYYKSEADNPTTLAIAQSELSASRYSHEIKCDTTLENSIININNTKLGTLFNIVKQSNIYESMLSGYSFNSESEKLSLKFGHIRSTLRQSIYQKLGV